MKAERLRIISGPGVNKEVYLAGPLSVGRSPENTLQLNDLQVSRKHAVIQQTPSGTVIRDLGSGNGTFVGDRRIIEHRLSPGDVIRIGQVELAYEVISRTDWADHGLGESVLFRDREEGMVHGNPAATIFQTFMSASREAKSAEQLRDAQSRLAAIYEANQIISSERDLRKLFGRVMDQLFTLIPAHNGVILLKDKDTGELVTEYVKTGSGQTEVAISSTIVARAEKQHEAVITYNAADDARFGAGASIIAQNISSAMCTPLRCQDESLGVIYVDTRGTKSAFTQSDLEMLVALAAPAAIAIRNAQYVNKLRQAYHETLITVANAIEASDHYTAGHTWRVTNFAVETARMLGWSEEKVKECEMGGVLHDVGKIAIDDAILHKPGRLDEAEFEKMKTHPEKGARMLQDCEFLLPLVPYALYHHEKYDGTGYPFGMKGEGIPIEGRLVAVADTFDAMTSNRPYRKGLDPETAITRIVECKGTQLDPAIVDVFVHCYREGKIERIMQEYHKGAKSIACPFCSTYIEIPADIQSGGEFDCGVCHRQLRLRSEDGHFFGEVIAAAERTHGSAKPA